MPPMNGYTPRYLNSFALVIGINQYQHGPPLGYAVNDARAVANVLVGKFGFAEENVKLLVDDQATKSSIMDSYMSHSREGERFDDRLLIFFAGHGHTVSGHRGEVGYLVPTDGDADNLATLIRWDDLTRNADLIPAKHILFIMDACYGGLAVMRHVRPGAKRFLKDMLLRHSRQVLTAGKADEVVADSGGPRDGHSIFTGHLLDALDGAAASGGYLTANGVMAYVYDRVAKDQHSKQTPHYGNTDGDGDFIFTNLQPDLFGGESKTKDEILIDVPSTLLDENAPTTEESQIATFKEYLSEPKHRIRLNDVVNADVRSTLQQLGTDNFPLQTSGTTIDKDFAARLKKYHGVISPLISKAVLLGKWGGKEHRPTLENMLARIADSITMDGGSTLWLGLRWHPIALLMYSAGIASLVERDYETFAMIHVLRVTAGSRYATGEQVEIIQAEVDGTLEVTRSNAWKNLEGYKNRHAPMSEYMSKILQPAIEDILFLGSSYINFFDRYEVLRALIYADLTDKDWGPIGQFGWKYARSRRLSGDDAFSSLLAEAKRNGDGWAIFKAGLFRGSYTRFEQVAKRFDLMLNKLDWY